MRYFFFSYSYPKGFGNLGIEKPSFPANERLKEIVAEHNKLEPDQIVILNIYEFQSEADYKKFFGQEE